MYILYAHSFHDMCICVLEWQLVGHIIDIIPVLLLTTKMHTLGEQRIMRIIHYKHSIDFFFYHWYHQAMCMHQNFFPKILNKHRIFISRTYTHRMVFIVDFSTKLHTAITLTIWHVFLFLYCIWKRKRSLVYQNLHTGQVISSAYNSNTVSPIPCIIWTIIHCQWNR